MHPARRSRQNAYEALCHKRTSRCRTILGFLRSCRTSSRACARIQLLPSLYSCISFFATASLRLARPFAHTKIQYERCPALDRMDPKRSCIRKMVDAAPTIHRGIHRMARLHYRIIKNRRNSCLGFFIFSGRIPRSLLRGFLFLPVTGEFFSNGGHKVVLILSSTISHISGCPCSRSQYHHSTPQR